MGSTRTQRCHKSADQSCSVPIVLRPKPSATENSMDDESLEGARQTSRAAARSMRIPTRQVEYIEARGFLCHELLFLLGGHIEYSLTPPWSVIRRLSDLIFPSFPLCRWYPSEESKLEQVGNERSLDSKVYRLCRPDSETVVFFVDYRPEPPWDVSPLFFPFNVPKLDEQRFLRPPFDDRFSESIVSTLRRGYVRSRRFTPIPMTDDARALLVAIGREMRRGLWEELVL